MATVPRSVEANLIRSDFGAFVRHAFRMVHGEKLGDQPYVDHLCYGMSRLIDGDINRLLINLPPQHLKSFVGTICLAAYLLGKNPRLRIILAAYNDTFAEALCGKIRSMMQTPWYQQAFWLFVRKYNPSVALIENTANGPALYSMVRRKAHFEIKLVTPRRDSKAVRFNDHLSKLRNKHIHLPELAIWREAFVAEVVAFPGEFDDQVDAMTQYLDFTESDPIIPPVRKREPLIARFNASAIRWRRR